MTHPCNVIILCTEFKHVKEEYWLWLILSLSPNIIVGLVYHKIKLFLSPLGTGTV